MPDAAPSTPASRLRYALADTTLDHLSVRQLTLLLYLSDNPLGGTREASDALDLERSAVTRSTQNLEARGLMTIGPVKGDRRLNAYEITPKGRAVIAPLLELMGG